MKNMNLRNATLCLLIGMVYTSCTTENYKKTEDGVIVLLNKSTANTTSQVRLQVLGEKLIRVSATPDKKFSERESLIITPQEKQFTDFKIDENDNDIILTTSEIKAHINKSNGEVCFTDIEGNIILEEKSSGGKSYTPITVEGKKQYSVQQIFESKEDEAFYGLGQHQADEFNYKGKNEELFQYNTKVSVPFVISNKNYGILWDSYSLCRFGDPRDYSQLNSVFEL